MRKTKAVEISEQQFSTCQKANRQLCSINTPLHHLLICHCVSQPYMQKKQIRIVKRCSLQIRNTDSATITTPIAPNVWILTSAPTVVSTGIMYNLSWRSSKIHQTETPIHIPHLPIACSTTSQNFLLHTLWKSWTDHQLISQHNKLKHDKYLISRIHNMATSRGPLEWDPASPLGQHTISFYWSTLQTHNQQQQTYHSFMSIDE